MYCLKNCISCMKFHGHKLCINKLKSLFEYQYGNFTNIFYAKVLTFRYFYSFIRKNFYGKATNYIVLFPHLFANLRAKCELKWNCYCITFFFKNHKIVLIAHSTILVRLKTFHIFCTNKYKLQRWKLFCTFPTCMTKRFKTGF